MGRSDTVPADVDAPKPAELSDVQADIVARASRLGQVVRAAGGTKAVAARSGVPEGRLKGYIAGRDMTASALVALARAMGADLVWLAIGDCPARRTEEFAAPQAEAGRSDAAAGMSWRAPDPEGSVGLAWNVHPDRIARAYEMALEGLVGLPDGPPDARRLMQITLLLYDDLSEADLAAAKPSAGAP